MKTLNGSKLSFGFGIVNSGKRSVSYEPQVIALSTTGGFKLTPAVTKLLGIQHGDNVMFITNADGIDAAIREKDASLVAFCEENGLDIATPEAAVAIHKAFDMFGVAKGIQEFTDKGTPKKCAVRLTKKDKIAYVSEHYDEAYAAAMESGDEALVAALTAEDVTREQIVAILAEGMESPETDKYTGSKCANSSAMLGTGTVVTFTDTNIWNQLKADMSAEDKGKYLRVYAVDTDDLQRVVVSNGCKDVEVPFLVLGEYEDKVVSERGAKDEDAE